jgi:hypothetical protein
MLVNINKIQTVAFIEGRKGSFRSIVKVKAGFLTVVEEQYKPSVIDVFRSYKKGALQAIEFRAEGTDTWLTVFAKNGKKVLVMDEELMKEIKVGDVNQLWMNTNLYDHRQYTAVNAKTWADKVFVMN